LLDGSLVPNVAQALQLVGYSFLDVRTVFQSRESVPDSEIIQWCGFNEAVWVYADDRRKRQHGKLIAAEAIRTTWVYRPRGEMSAKEQFTIMAYFLPDILERFARGQLHVKLTSLGRQARHRFQIEEYTL